jgi:hypothetical protein
MAEGPGGIFVKGDDGSLYFVRDELLEACKVEGEDLEKWGPVVDGQTPEVEGFSLNFDLAPQSSTPMVVRGAQLNPAGDLTAVSGRARHESTIMCPW